MLELLRTQDPDLIELNCGSGSVLIAPTLNGRIFCQWHGELIHRLDVAALQSPSKDEYNNLGGNSLWPAPEGGEFAWNYPPSGAPWMVQDGIAKCVPKVYRVGENCVLIEKRITLGNRKGFRFDLGYRRLVSVPQLFASPHGYNIVGMAYRTEDSFEPYGDYPEEDLLLAPWSLEQFPGAEGIVAFGKVNDLQNAINSDFYGTPGDRVELGDGQFVFRLGGSERHQIGIHVDAHPQFIGALDPQRGLLILRKTDPQPGRYFNIADNEQPAGPDSAADLYSIFNGGELGFFELETIGAMRSFQRKLAVGSLFSQTTILKGDLGELQRYLLEELDIRLSV